MQVMSHEMKKKKKSFFLPGWRHLSSGVYVAFNESTERSCARSWGTELSGQWVSVLAVPSASFGWASAADLRSCEQLTPDSESGAICCQVQGRASWGLSSGCTRSSQIPDNVGKDYLCICMLESGTWLLNFLTQKVLLQKMKQAFAITCTQMYHINATGID